MVELRTSHQVILKVTSATWNRLQVGRLWERTADPPRFCWA